MDQELLVLCWWNQSYWGIIMGDEASLLWDPLLVSDTHLFHPRHSPSPPLGGHSQVCKYALKRQVFFFCVGQLSPEEAPRWGTPSCDVSGTPSLKPLWHWAKQPTWVSRLRATCLCWAEAGVCLDKGEAVVYSRFSNTDAQVHVDLWCCNTQRCCLSAGKRRPGRHNILLTQCWGPG